MIVAVLKMQKLKRAGVQAVSKTFSGHTSLNVLISDEKNTARAHLDYAESRRSSSLSFGKWARQEPNPAIRYDYNVLLASPYLCLSRLISVLPQTQVSADVESISCPFPRLSTSILCVDVFDCPYSLYCTKCQVNKNQINILMLGF